MTLGWRLGAGRGDLSILSFSQTSPKACHNRFLQKVMVIRIDKKVTDNRYQQPKLVPVQTENWERQFILSHG